MQTSGSTGEPREVLLSGSALLASVTATHEALGGGGQWLLCVPETRVAGAMVLARSQLAGTEPVRIAPGPFTAEAFADAVAALEPGTRHYVSLVPTQLMRIVDSARGMDALGQLDAALVGGAALPGNSPPPPVVATYGASETCGGCVYDGRPLAGVDVRLVDGVIHLAGPMLAEGYADGEDSRFVEEAGRSWFVTSDAGEFDGDGRLRVIGRVDDVINSGGLKLHPAPIEAAVRVLPWVADAVAVGVPDAQWGERVVVVVAGRPGITMPPWDEVRRELAVGLEAAAVPKGCVIVDALPRLSSGKIDRARVRRLAKESDANR